MASEAVDLIAQSLCRDAVVLLRPFRIMFPVITAAPACEDEDAVAVCQVEEFVSIQRAFLANRIQIHVANRAKLIFQTLSGLAHHHVRRPAIGSSEKPLPVQFYKKEVLLGSCVAFFRSALTVRCAVFNEGKSNFVSTNGCRNSTGPLVVRYTRFHRPISLSGGAGFQSTKSIARSISFGGKTSMARTFVVEDDRYSVTLSSYRRQAPAI